MVYNEIKDITIIHVGGQMSKFNYGSFMIFAYVIARYTHIQTHNIGYQVATL